MNPLYIIFAMLVPAAFLFSLFPALSGKGEAVAVGGFEYSLFLSKKWLFVGSFFISASGISFLITLENLSALRGWVSTLTLLFLLLLAAFGIVLISFYLGYKLTVRGNTMLYKLPLKKEIAVSFCEISRYKIKSGKNGETGIKIYAQNKVFIFAENTSPSFSALCASVRAHTPEQK